MTSMTDSPEPVVFDLGDGREFSYDPRWRQADAVDEDINEDGTYDTMTVADLKALAKERSLDLAGITKKSQLVALLITDDGSLESDHEGEPEDETSDEDEPEDGEE